MSTSESIAVPETKITEEEAALLADINSFSPPARQAFDEVLAAIQDLAVAQVEPLLRRVIHRVFERSMAEFFADEVATSIQLPAELVRYTVPHPDGIPLPRPDSEPDLTLAEALQTRRSHRNYAKRALSLDEVGAVLHMALASNATEDGYGTRNIPQMPYPNIGGLDPVEIGFIAHAVDGLEPGYYRYDKVGHALVLVSLGDYRMPLINATFENDWIFYAPAVLIVSNDQRKVSWKYKTRGYRIAGIDLGAALQNIYLACTAYHLSCCAVAGYHDERINHLLRYPSGDISVGCLVPIGARPAPRGVQPNGQ